MLAPLFGTATAAEVSGRNGGRGPPRPQGHLAVWSCCKLERSGRESLSSPRPPRQGGSWRLWGGDQAMRTQSLARPVPGTRGRHSGVSQSAPAHSRLPLKQRGFSAPFPGSRTYVGARPLALRPPAPLPGFAGAPRGHSLQPSAGPEPGHGSKAAVHGAALLCAKLRGLMYPRLGRAVPAGHWAPGPCHERQPDRGAPPAVWPGISPWRAGACSSPFCSICSADIVALQ